MRVGRVVCARAWSKLTMLPAMSRNVSRETTTRMYDNVPQTLTTDDADFSVGSMGSVVKRERVTRRTVQTTTLTFLIMASCLAAFAQASGRLKGVVRTAAGAPASGVVVVVT